MFSTKCGFVLVPDIYSSGGRMWDCVAAKLAVMAAFPSMPSVCTVGKPTEEMFLEELRQGGSVISAWSSPKYS